MAQGRAELVEGAVDAAAALLLAAALGVVLLMVEANAAFCLALPALAFFGIFHGLQRVSPEAGFALSPFDPGAVVPVQPAILDELVLTDADRLDRQELVLDQALAHIGPGSRVVRLFEPAAMPTPGELQARIERHFDDNADLRADIPRTAPPDASQALFEALAELRRSMR